MLAVDAHGGFLLPVPAASAVPLWRFRPSHFNGPRFRRPIFFAQVSAGHMRDAANRAISTVASYPIPFVVIVTSSFPLNR
ncbi:MAG: hypothetical protein FP819_03150 [Rhizobiaceae bacterium]|nr:hypothetical protein [Rhizobiaceae bacterium]